MRYGADENEWEEEAISGERRDISSVFFLVSIMAFRIKGCYLIPVNRVPIRRPHGVQLIF
jgi:hypothetical protein